jgi:MFS family permease
MMSGGMVLMINALPLEKRPAWMGAVGATIGIASVVGPLLGGTLTTNVSWRWCFYSKSDRLRRQTNDPNRLMLATVNLPIGAVTLIAVTLILKPNPPFNNKSTLTPKQKLLQLDPLGTLFLLPCLICLLLALQWGGSSLPWSDGRVIALLTLFAILLIAFVTVQVFQQKTAQIPASIVKNRSMLAGGFFIFNLAGSMMLMVYYIPLYFQAVKGVSAEESGIRTIPLVLSLVAGSIVSGIATGKIGYYTQFAYVSAAIMPIGAGLISTWKVDTGHAEWIGFQVLYGFSLGLGMQQAQLAAQTVLKRVDVPTGMALVVFMQTLGGAVFLSVGQNVLTSHLVGGIGRLLVEGLDPAVIVNTGATDLRDLVPAEQLPAVLEVYSEALRRVFLISTGLASVTILGALGLEWRSVKKSGKSVVAKKDEAEDVEQ